MKLEKEISSIIKEFGKPALKSELRDLIIDQWREEIAEDTSGSVVKVSKHDMKEQFQVALDTLCGASKLRITGEGKEAKVEYVKKSARRGSENDIAVAISSSRSSSSSSSSSSGSSSSSNSNTKRDRSGSSGSGSEITAASIDGKVTKKGRKIGDDNETPTSAVAVAKVYPPPEPKKLVGDKTILLFYAYCKPPMSRDAQDKAITHFYAFLKNLNITGRLRIGREGYNCTLTGQHDAIRKFTSEAQRYDVNTFGKTDFKYVDNQPENQLLPTLKVFPVSEIVNYGFNAGDAPLEMGGIHLKPQEFHKALENPNSVVIDVRNYNEALIGKFQPPENAEDGHVKYLDPEMRKSTEFPEWVEKNKKSWEGKQVLMYCTAGVRCERASAFMRNQGVENVYQLEGGIHRYLEAFPDDGGYWKGKNYTFDKRFSHGAKQSEIISYCVYCNDPWERYNSGQKCFKCKMEILLCNVCSRLKPSIKKSDLFCPLCLPRTREKKEEAVAAVVAEK